MRKILTFLLLVIAIPADSAKAPIILVFGDSLSAGFGIDVDHSWPTLLRFRLKGQGYEHQVVNASISGETTEGGATRIQGVVDRYKPQVIVLELGGNDGLRGFPPERIRSNLKMIIETSKAGGAAVVLLGIRIPSNYGPRYTQDFEKIYRELAVELDVPWIEFFMAGIAMNKDLMQEDGIHPNQEAQPILLDNAWPMIRRALERARRRK